MLRPLRQLYGASFELSPLTAVVDPFRFREFERSSARGDLETDLMYLFRKQLQDADLLAVNKADLLSADAAAEVVHTLQSRYPAAAVVSYSAASGIGLDDLLRLWQSDGGALTRNLDIDYERYSAAEAGLAWLNQTFELSATDSFDPRSWISAVLAQARDLCHGHGCLIGHIKLAVSSANGMTKASLIGSGDVCFDLPGPSLMTTAYVIVNARIACDPPTLEAIVASAVREADSSLGVDSSPPEGRSFKPGRPVPTHRLLAVTGC